MLRSDALGGHAFCRIEQTSMSPSTPNFFLPDISIDAFEKGRLACSFHHDYARHGRHEEVNRISVTWLTPPPLFCIQASKKHLRLVTALWRAKMQFGFVNSWKFDLGNLLRELHHLLSYSTDFPVSGHQMMSLLVKVLTSTKGSICICHSSESEESRKAGENCFTNAPRDALIRKCNQSCCLLLYVFLKE